MIEPVLTQDIVRSLLHYSRSTGKFTWKTRPGAKSWNTRYAGKEAGSRWTPDGGKTFYIVLRIFDYPFLAHRVARLYVRGRWPKRNIDHKDLDGTNNKWINLRAASHKQNGLNRGANKNSSTGIKGVSPCKDGTFRATIQINGKWKWLGAFKTKAAAAARYQAEVETRAGKFGRIA